MLYDSVFMARASRQVQQNIPAGKQQRDDLMQLARQYVLEKQLVGPVSLAQLKKMGDEIIGRTGVTEECTEFLAVVINNEIWRDTVAAVPYDRRLLLLPKCLRDSGSCQGDFDHIGLICAHCGGCIIDSLKSQAEKLGYAVLIAEGTPIVMSLIQTGQIEAVIGVSCLSTLEQAFPFMEAGAIPGIAVPLLYDGCAETFLDIDWLTGAMYDSRSERRQRLNIHELRRRTSELFNESNLGALLIQDNDETERIALDWMLRAGKRWRPAMMLCTFAALADSDQETFCAECVHTAVAVECFHKASLIHDDIEDDDDTRYGSRTLHAEYNIGIALNVGDFLLGEGYRLLAGLKIDDCLKGRMIAAAAAGHRKLSQGQGAKLLWNHKPQPLTIEQVLSIFERKTAPAFEVALRLGAILAGRGEDFDSLFSDYSRHLGIAYQIQDDINDFDAALGAGDLFCGRLSVLIAAAFEKASQDQKKLLETFWTCQTADECLWQEVRSIVASTGAKRTALEMLSFYKYKAVETLAEMKDENLKGLLRIVVSKVFHEIDIMLCCDDNTNRND